jgi:hypothetical protein
VGEMMRFEIVRKPGREAGLLVLLQISQQKMQAA